MYAQHFGLKREPFSIAPDPRYLFMSERHREALAHLRFGLRGGGGFVLLTGEVGTGKTTLCRSLLEQPPERCNLAYVFNPRLSALEMLHMVCQEFRVPVPSQGPGPQASAATCIQALNEFLLRTHAVGQVNVLVIDEAQNLAPEVLEQLRLLTNLETSERKLLQVVLIGQPELRVQLAQPQLEQVAQRIIARYHLQALGEAETAQYVRHRLLVAGASGSMPFSRSALARVHSLSRGVPRRINLLCDRALLGAYGSGGSRVDAAMVEHAAQEVFALGDEAMGHDSFARPRRVQPALLAGGALLLAAGVAAGLAWRPVAAPAAMPRQPGAASAAVLAAASLPAAASAAVPASAAALRAPPPPATELAFAPLWRSEAEAWRGLAALWGLAAPASPDALCNAGRRAAVQCLRDSGMALPTMQRLGRPALLTLRDADGQPGYALLVALGDDRLTLQAGASTQTVALPALASRWRGEYATLYRTPPGYRGPGEIDAANTELRQWIAQRLDQAAPADAQAPLLTRLTRFQLAQGLKPDARIGPLTLMQLAAAGGGNEPRLAALASERGAP